MVNQNKIFSFIVKCQAKNIFPRDVKRTVVDVQADILHKQDETHLLVIFQN